jgi:hypothetical protein
MASGPVFMFCAPVLVFSDTEGVGSRFPILRSRTLFRRCRVRRVPFSRFARPDSVSAVPRASSLVFTFYAPGHIFGGTEGVGSRFHVLRARAHFRRYGGRRVPFSSFALPESFSAVLRASGPIFTFCAPGLVFGCTEGVRFRFHVLRTGLLFDGVACVGSYSCFARLDSFSAVARASRPFIMFFALGLVFGGTEGVTSCFQVLRSRTHFRWC